VSVAVCLLLYAAAVCVVAPRLLPLLTGAGASPRFGVAAWLIVLASVLASWVGAAIALPVALVAGWHRPGSLRMGECVAALRSAAFGHNGSGTQLAVAVLAVAVAGFVTVLAARVGAALTRTRTRTREHAASARIIGRRVPGLDALVVDAPQKVVYCLAGRPGTVVVTSSAVTALDNGRLEAVLSHERAHLAGRHHLLLSTTRALATSLPRIRLFSVAAQDVSRLLEMCADDTAAATHSRAAVLDAILTLAGTAPVPSGALGASTVGVSARVARLAYPSRARQRLRTQLLLMTFTAVLLAAPIAAAWAATHGLSACGPFST
jgi:Zn-dependent protease with chaperone function